MSLKWTAAAVLTLAAHAAHADWHHGLEADPAEGRRIWLARLESLNAAMPAPPAPGFLAVRQSARFGPPVDVEVELGRLPCEARPVCRVFARFDDRPPIAFDSRPSGRDTENARVLLEPAEKFVAWAARARRIRLNRTSADTEPLLEFLASTPLRRPVQE